MFLSAWRSSKLSRKASAEAQSVSVCGGGWLVGMCVDKGVGGCGREEEEGVQFSQVNLLG